MNKVEFLERVSDWEKYHLVRIYKNNKEQAKFICSSVEVTDRWIHMDMVYLVLGKDITEPSIRYSSTFGSEEVINIEVINLEKLKTRI